MTEIQVVTKKTPKKEGREAVTRMNSLLSRAMESRNGTVASCVAEAVGIYSHLDDKQRLKYLKNVRTRLRQNSKGVFGAAPVSKETESKARSTAVIASFLGGIAPALPAKRDADGTIAFPTDRRGKTKAPKVYRHIYGLLGNIASAAYVDEKEHIHARRMANAAMWQLDYSSAPYWLGRLEDPVTRDQTIAYLLNMPRNVPHEQHGWKALEDVLGTYGRDIARHPSPAAIDFLLNAVQNRDAGVAVNAFHAAAYLPVVPPELLDIAQRMQLPPPQPQPETTDPSQLTLAQPSGPQPITCDPEVKQAAHELIFIAEARGLVAGGEEFAGVFALVMLYKSGATDTLQIYDIGNGYTQATGHRAGESAWLRPMLEEACAGAEEAAKATAAQPGSPQHRNALAVLGALGLAGIKVPAGILQQGDIPIPLSVLELSRYIVFDCEEVNGGRAAALELLDLRVRNEQIKVLGGSGNGMRLIGDQIYTVVPGLVQIYKECPATDARKKDLEALIQAIGVRMADTVVNPGGQAPAELTARRNKTMQVLSSLAEIGIDVPHSGFLDASIMFTAKNAAPVPPGCIAEAVSGTAAECVLAAAVNLDAIPDAVLAFANKQTGCAQTPAILEKALDVIFINDAKKLLAQDDAQQFAGAFAISLLFRAGKPHLSNLVGSILIDASNTFLKSSERLEALAKLRERRDAAAKRPGNDGSELERLGAEITACEATESADTVRRNAAHEILYAMRQLGIKLDGERIEVSLPPIPQEIVDAAVELPVAQCVLCAGAYLVPAATSRLTSYATKLANGSLSDQMNAANEYLVIRRAQDSLYCGDDKQYMAVYDIIELYKDGRKDLAMLLAVQAAEMADVAMSSSAKGKQDECRKAWDALCAIAGTGVDVSYHELRAAAYLSPVPGDMVSFAGALLGQPDVHPAMQAAARDLIALNDLQEEFKKPGSSPTLLAHALISIQNAGTGNAADLIEVFSAKMAQTILQTDSHVERQKALHVLASLGGLSMPARPPMLELVPFGTAADALFTASLGQEIQPGVDMAMRAMAAGRYPASLKEAAGDFITVVDAREKLASPDPSRQLEGARTLVELSAIRGELGPLVRNEALPLAVALFHKDGDPKQKAGAAGVLQTAYTFAQRDLVLALGGDVERKLEQAIAAAVPAEQATVAGDKNAA